MADGMRGRPRGEVASRLAAQVVQRAFYSHPTCDPVQGLWNAVTTANGWVRYWSETRPDLRGMRTTLTAVVAGNQTLTVAHVGDSRAYLVRPPDVWRLTSDHTWAARAVFQGVLTQEEARNHPWRHVLTRSLGGSNPMVDVRQCPYAPNDRLVVCSDGVSDLLSGHEISWLARHPPRRAAKAMVRAAQRRGSQDDASVIVVALGRSARQRRVAQPHRADVGGAYRPQGRAAGPTRGQRRGLLALGSVAGAATSSASLAALAH
jgi:protein phosphatase